MEWVRGLEWVSRGKESGCGGVVASGCDLSLCTHPCTVSLSLSLTSLEMGMLLITQ